MLRIQVRNKSRISFNTKIISEKKKSPNYSYYFKINHGILSRRKYKLFK